MKANAVRYPTSEAVDSESDAVRYPTSLPTCMLWMNAKAWSLLAVESESDTVRYSTSEAVESDTVRYPTR